MFRSAYSQASVTLKSPPSSMHTEVHVHGDVPLRRGAVAADVEAALRPWLDYVDVDSLAEATSAREDEPGIALDVRRRVLQICWTGYVGRNFSRAVESALAALGEFSESTVEVEVSYYHDDGRDEFGTVFVGPSIDDIERAKRARMVVDVTNLLTRQFNEDEIREVTAVVQKLFDQRGVPAADEPSAAALASARRSSRHLH